MFNFKKIFLFLLFASSINLCMEMEMGDNNEPPIHATTEPQELDTYHEEELLQSIVEEELKQRQLAEEAKEVVTIQQGLALINNKTEQQATAIFEIPTESKIATLSEEEKQKIRDAIEVLSVENRNGCKIIHFHYKDSSALPENKDQAILIYSAYLDTENKSDKPQTQLDDVQKKIDYLKALEKVKKENEKDPRLEAVKKKFEALHSVKEGLIGNTKVKTQNGYTKLEELKLGDQVACFDIKNSQETYTNVTYIDKIHVFQHVQIVINNDQIIQVAPEHKFYIHDSETWIMAQDLSKHPELWQLIDSHITKISIVDQELDVIRLTVGANHNFYITDHNILVHNFIPIVLEVGILFGENWDKIEVTWSLLGPTIASTAAGVIFWFKNKFDKDSNEQQVKRAIDAGISSGGGGSIQPDKDPDKDKNKNDRKKDPKITTKEATKAAEELGFEKTNYYTSTNQPIYKKDKTYISPDADRHNGGFWKVANNPKNLELRSTRMGTYDRSLKTRIGN